MEKRLAQHEVAILTPDVPSEGLVAGDVGTVVHVHRGGEAYEVEFLTLSGATVAVATIRAGQLRAVAPTDMAHAREYAAA